MRATGRPPKTPDLPTLPTAPTNHQLLLENDRARVLLTTIPRGATTPVHTHRWPSVEHVLGTTNFVRRDADQNVLLDTRAADPEPPISDVLWSDPFPPHSLENVGDTELRVTMVEIKQRSQAEPSPPIRITLDGWRPHASQVEWTSVPREAAEPPTDHPRDLLPCRRAFPSALITRR